MNKLIILLFSISFLTTLQLYSQEKKEVAKEGTKKDSTSDKTKTDSDVLKPYWVEMGSNIDFVDGPKLNNLTGGIFYQKLDKSWGSTSQKRWALFAGAYEAKIVSDVTTKKDTLYNLLNNNSYASGRKDTVNIYKYAGRPKQTQTIRNWSFFVSPSWRFTNGMFNDSNFHLFASFWAELRYQEIEFRTDNSSLILIDSNYENINRISDYKSSSDTINRTGIYSHYYGFGIPFYYEDKSIILFLNPVFGISNQPSAGRFIELSKRNVENQGSSIWHPFYFVQFRLSDNLFGLTVTGEIRGLVIKNSPPQYTIAITKKFNLEKLLIFNNTK